jgi:hypothetical protein
VDLLLWSEPGHATRTEAYVQRLGELRELGATWTTVALDRRSLRAALDDLRAWGEVRRSLPGDLG